MKKRPLKLAGLSMLELQSCRMTWRPSLSLQTSWKLAGECCKGLGYDGRVASDEVCYCDSDPDLSGPAGYRGEGSEGFRCGRSICPVEQMVVY